jgi:hypothetical protein
MVNARLNTGLQNRHISQFKGLINVFNYWNWRDNERVKLREEILVMLVQFELKYHLVFRS